MTPATPVGTRPATGRVRVHVPALAHRQLDPERLPVVVFARAEPRVDLDGVVRLVLERAGGGAAGVVSAAALADAAAARGAAACRPRRREQALEGTGEGDVGERRLRHPVGEGQQGALRARRPTPGPP